ncbi:hypothetical protein A3860_25945 [Niastella vici]|uniref:Uncharacterized protein n=1 Tax=Niastella vici TaxID=1703345 RepID=A0A1V9FYA3_9BACT|nr:hypothetical protein A3860_25945 [Niastella vici]
MEKCGKHLFKLFVIYLNQNVSALKSPVMAGRLGEFRRNSIPLLPELSLFIIIDQDKCFAK